MPLAHRALQRLPVNRGRAGAIRRNVRAQVDRAEAAVLVRSQPLFAARVGRLQVVQMRDGVAAVGRVDKERARFAVVVGVPDDRGEQVARPDRLGNRAIARVAQVEVAVILDRMHELVGERDRNVEIGDRALFGLAADELVNIGVIDPQHAHIGAAPRSSLRDLAESLVVDAQKADRPGRAPGRRVYDIFLRAQPAEAEAVAPARLLDQRRHPQRAEDAVVRPPHVVFRSAARSRRPAGRAACPRR